MYCQKTINTEREREREREKKTSFVEYIDNVLFTTPFVSSSSASATQFR